MLDGISRRALLFVLKKWLSQLLKNEPDLDQVDARLREGILELREALLDCEYLNKLLAFSGLEVTAGFISRIEVQFNLATLTTRVALEEVLLTVQPRSDGPSSPPPPTSHRDSDDSFAAAGDPAFEQNILSEFLNAFFKNLSVVVVGLKIRLENGELETEPPSAVVTVHGDRLVYGREENGVDEGGKPSFVLSAEGLSVDIEKDDESSDKHDESSDAHRIPLVFLEGGQVKVTPADLAAGVNQYIGLTLGKLAVSVDPGNLSCLNEGIDTLQRVVRRWSSSQTGGEDVDDGRTGYGWGSVDGDEDDVEFFDSNSRFESAASSISGREELDLLDGLGYRNRSGNPAVEVCCTLPVISLSVEYWSSSGAGGCGGRETVGGLDMFLQKVEISGVLQKGGGPLWNASVDSIVCYECMPKGESRLSPGRAQQLIGQIESVPGELHDLVKHGGQVTVSEEGDCCVYPLFQFGLSNRGDGGAEGADPCLRIRVGEVDREIDRGRKTVKVEVRSLPIFVWATCASLKNILGTVDRAIKCLEKKPAGARGSSSSQSINRQVQSVIDDIGRSSNPAGCNVEYSWFLPGIFGVLEKADCGNSDEGGLLFLSVQSQERLSFEADLYPFLSVMKVEGLASARGASVHSRQSMQSLQIRAREAGVHNISWMTKAGKGRCTRIVRAEARNPTRTTESTNLMLDLDLMEDGCAIRLDVQIKDKYCPNDNLVNVAESFVDWHSGDRWAEGDGCWHEEGSYREVEFQDKCVNSAKVSVRTHFPSLKIDATEDDIADVMRLVSSMGSSDGKSEGAAEEENTEEEKCDQVAILLTGSVEASLRPAPQSAETSTSSPSNPFHLLIDDLGILKSTGLSGKQSSLLWAWCRGIKLTGGVQETCCLYAPGPSDSQLPNPMGIEFAQLDTRNRSSEKGQDRVSLRVKGITVATEVDDLNLSLLRSLASYAPPSGAKRRDSPKSKDLSFAINAENIGLRVEPARGYTPVDGCPEVGGVAYIEGVHLVGNSGSESNRAVFHSLSLHLANVEKRKAGRWDIGAPVDVQSIQLQHDGYCCVAQEGILYLGVDISKADPGGEGPSRVEVEVGNQQLRGNFTHESLGLMVLFVRQIQGEVPVVPLEDVQGEAEQGGGLLERGLMEALEENTFRQVPVVNSMMASECAKGTWCEEVDGMTDIMDEWIADVPSSAFCPSEDYSTGVHQGSDSRQGVWLEGGPPELLDDYVQVPSPSDRNLGSSMEWSSCLRLSKIHPEPVFTLGLKNMSAVWVLHDDSTAAAKKEGVLKLEVSGLNVRVDSFPENKHYVWRTAVQVQSLQLRDCRCCTSESSSWQYILSRHRQRSRKPNEQRMPGPTAPMIEFVLEAVQPRAEEGREEFRMSIELVPLRLRLDQAVINFLLGYARTLPPAPPPPTEAEQEEVPFFQHCEIAALYVVVDYRPRKLDWEGFRNGSAVEVLNFVRWGGVKLNLKKMTMAGILGWDSFFEVLGREWQADIVGNQVHKFLTAIPPMQSFKRIGSAGRDVLSAFVNAVAPPARAGCPHPKSPPTRQLRRSAVTLLRVLALEVLNAGVSVSSGAQMVLQGSMEIPSSPAGRSGGGSSGRGVNSGVREVRASLDRAIKRIVTEPVQSWRNGDDLGTVIPRVVRAAPAALVAPATMTAAAARCTLVACRNTLDSDRSLDE
ncbi:hypothetical protein BSKO_07287 [Bryopsis sp. KO-2023]|nr:hypothetical protein BSKO_07287 [Bryopsis sp. KO-2023]